MYRTLPGKRSVLLDNFPHSSLGKTFCCWVAAAPPLVPIVPFRPLENMFHMMHHAMSAHTNNIPSGKKLNQALQKDPQFC